MPSLGSVRSSSSNSSDRRKRRGWCGYYWDWIVGFVGVLWFSLVFVVEFLVRLLWVSDRRTAISGGDGVELWPRKLVTARLCLQDMKIVKKAIAHAVSL